MFKFLLLLSLGWQSLAHAAQPMRIVSSGGSITEIIYALGKQDLLVATDSTSYYPAAANALPKLGYFRQLSVEGVLGFQPTDLIGAHATGPDTLAEQLRGAGVRVNILTEQRNVAGLYQLIEQVAQLVDAKPKALVLINNIKAQVAELKIQAEGLMPLNALFVMTKSERGLTVAGFNTVPQALFNDANMRNAGINIPDYKVMDNESILAANPDVVFVASHQIQGPQDLLQLCQHPALKATKAGQHCAIYALDSSNALALSPRYPQALKQLITISQKVSSDGH